MLIIRSLKGCLHACETHLTGHSFKAGFQHDKELVSSMCEPGEGALGIWYGTCTNLRL